jgi:hypothetical protein
LVGTASLRDIAAVYRVSQDALGRHKADHLPLTVAKAEATKHVEQARGIVASGLDVVAQLRAINGVTMHVLQEARDRHDGELALKAVDRVQRQIELQAKLLGDLDERPVVNILIAPEWLSVRTTLLRALQPYPEARTAVAAALTGVERGNG